MSAFELVWDSRCGVAESPVWDAANRRVLFCDIGGKKINALSVDSGERETWDLPEVVGSFGLCRTGRLVVALRHRAVLFDPENEGRDRTDPAVIEPTTNRLPGGGGPRRRPVLHPRRRAAHRLPAGPASDVVVGAGGRRGPGGPVARGGGAQGRPRGRCRRAGRAGPADVVGGPAQGRPRPPRRPGRSHGR